MEAENFSKKFMGTLNYEIGEKKFDLWEYFIPDVVSLKFDEGDIDYLCDII